MSRDAQAIGRDLDHFKAMLEKITSNEAIGIHMDQDYGSLLLYISPGGARYTALRTVAEAAVSDRITALKKEFNDGQ